MTLGEKVGNIVGWIADSITGGGMEPDDDPFRFGGDSDEGYVYEGSAVRKPDTYTTRVSSEDTNVVKHPNYKGHEVRIMEPRSYGDTTQIVKQLLEQKTVMLHLHLLDKEQAQRTIDFVCGASFALGGTPQQVGDVFVFTPSNVQLSVESKEHANFANESYWGVNSNYNKNV